jgi:hypothetical protein
VIARLAGAWERVERTFEALYPGATAVERSFETSLLELAERAALELRGRKVLAGFSQPLA